MVDGQVVAKTSASLRIPDDWIVPIEISDVKGTSLELKWPQVSVQIATLEVLYEKQGACDTCTSKIFFWFYLIIVYES